ncbi:MAG TPA: pilus assembly protein PilM, partial [Candidatus Polarisedimenticolaceae bacterium]|nr:pilus assembly protein PilM [Candidatus Polarisedimenticolaceae bacterium]
RRGRRPPLLEAALARALPEQSVPSSLFETQVGALPELVRRLRELYELSGTRPGRVSLLLPDNLAKVALLTLPERPGSRRQLEEVIRFKLRRAVPFRLEETSLSYQVLGGVGREIVLLVVLARRAIVEHYEQALAAIGARVGMIDITTPSLFNLCRARLAAAGGEGDVALLNCSQRYFSLLIARGGRLIFYRCKTYAATEGENGAPNGQLTREIANSLSYYQDKLAGTGLRGVLVRSVAEPFPALAARLGELGLAGIEPIVPAPYVEVGPALEPELQQRVIPAVGAATGGR